MVFLLQKNLQRCLYLCDWVCIYMYVYVYIYILMVISWGTFLSEVPSSCLLERGTIHLMVRSL